MKKAVLVGINYPNTTYQLRGCVNDVVAINEVLVNHLGFTDPKYIRMLTDESATTANIIERLEWLVDGAVPGDVLYFHYSGHGSQTIHLDYSTMEEPDGLDEIIVPVDINWRDKIIKDDDFQRIFDKLPEGVNLTVVLDCCHSGDGLRGDILPPPELRDALLGPTRTRSIPMPVDVANRGFGMNLEAKDKTLNNKEDQKGLLFAGCRSYQTSADAWFQAEGKFHGALTYYMMSILKEHNYTISNECLVLKLAEVLAGSGFHQQPELDGKSSMFTSNFLFPI